MSRHWGKKTVELDPRNFDIYTSGGKRIICRGRKAFEEIRVQYFADIDAEQWVLREVPTGRYIPEPEIGSLLWEDHFLQADFYRRPSADEQAHLSQISKQMKGSK